MARKGREPLVEAPPPAASSSDEEESSSDEEEEQPEKVNEKQPSSSEEEEEEDDDNEEEEEEEDEDEEEEETLPKNPPSPPPKTSIQKKPESPKLAALPKATVLASPAPTAKRKGSDNEKGTPKKSRKEKSEGTGDEGKKPLFQRLWSDDDEVAILQGMIEYKDQKGTDPMTDADDFLEFIKKSLHVDANKAQIVNKVRSLKRKLETAKKKKKITDEHGIKVFELSKRVWESDEVNDNGGVDGKDSNSKSRSVKKRVGKLEKLKSSEKEMSNGMVVEGKKEEEKGDEKEQNWVVSKCEKELKLDDLGSYGFLKESVKFIGEEEKVKLEEKWKRQNLTELKVYLHRLDLIKDMAQKILGAINSE